MALAMVALALVGCRASQPSAPYSSDVRTASIITNLRSDTPISAEEKSLCDAVRAAEAQLSEWWGRSPRTELDLWVLSRREFERQLRKFPSSKEAGALTRIRNFRSDIYAHAPRATDSLVGDCLETRFRQFQVAHEVVHAWIGGRSTPDLEEGFANFIAQRAMRTLGGPEDPVALVGPWSAAAHCARLLDRAAGRPGTVDEAADADGEDAYLRGWLLFDFAATRLAAEEFKTFVQDLLVDDRFANVAAQLAGARGKSRDEPAAADERVNADYAAYSSRLARELGGWCIAAGLLPVGVTPDGTTLVVGDDVTLLVALAEAACQTAESRALDEKLDGPALKRVRAFSFRRPAGAMAWRIEAGEANRVNLSAAGARGARTVAAGEWLHIAIDGSDAVLRDDSHAELHRWKDGACQLMTIDVDVEDRDGTLGVLEFRASD